MAVVLGHTNLIDDATLGGTGWETDYPVDNLQDRYLFKRAKSSGNSATITLDLGSAQAVGIVALCRHTLSAAATVRVSGGAFDSGIVTIYPGADYAILIATETAQNWTIEIDDAAPFELGRVFIGATFQPANCVDWGTATGLETTSNVVQSLGGNDFFDIRSVRRIWSGQWSWLDDAEAYDILNIMRRSDISSEVFFVGDSDLTSGQGEAWYLGRFKELSSVAYPYLDTYSVPIQISELL